MSAAPAIERPVAIPCGAIRLTGTLTLPQNPRGVAVFVHGSGSSQRSLRNRYVAGVLVERGYAALLFDLLSADGELALLGQRVVAAIDWVAQQRELAHLPLALVGSSTGAAVALQAAAVRPERVRALVSRGGRPDLAFSALGLVHCPILLIVGGHDLDVLELNQWAAAHLLAPHRLAVVPGASHLFEEPGTLQQAAELTAGWLADHLRERRARAAGRPAQ